MTIHPLFVAIVQGLTEAFPVSSSAHIAWLFYPNSVPKGLDAVVHMGSFFALCLCFRSTLYDLFIGAWHTVSRKKSIQKSAFLTVLVTTVPCGMVGLVCALCHIRFDTIAVTACSMIICGGVLYYADRRPIIQPSVHLAHIPRHHAIILGITQILALIPGVSRLGIGIITGRLLGYSLHWSAQTSFIIGLPLMASASLVHIPHLMHAQVSWTMAGLLATVTMALNVPLVTLFLWWTQSFSMTVFALYRIGVGCMLLSKIMM
jgi:undecaprenyl-diphosphatase